MRFATDRDQKVHDRHHRMMLHHREVLAAAERGDRQEVERLHHEVMCLAREIADLRAEPGHYECRHCGELSELGDQVELSVNGITIERPHPPEGEGPFQELFPPGKELHLYYCPECAAESGLMEYLRKR